MSRVNADTVIAVLLIALCGAFFKASFDIRDLGYESMGAEVWPRIVLAALFVMSCVYLVDSIRKSARQGSDDPTDKPDLSIPALVRRYQNAFFCFVIFLLFLLTLDYLGMLIGGVLFVFLTLTALGNRRPRDHLIHAAIALISIGVMWSIFTFGLKVFLPEGEILRIW